MHGGLGMVHTLSETLKTERAQTLLRENREKNLATKNQIEEEINSLTIVPDKEEPQKAVEQEERRFRTNRCKGHLSRI